MSAQKSVRPWFNRHLFFGAAACLLFTLPAANVVAAGDNKEAVAKVVRLNKEARQFFDADEFSLAEKSLQKALEIGEAASLGNHVVMAGTHGNLAVLYASGLKNEEQAVFHFKKALELQPQYLPSAGTDTPEVKELFERARSEMEPATPAPSPEASEPPPAPPQGPLRCPTASSATAGSSVKLRCVVEGSLQVAEVTVAFRAGDSAPFKSRKMSADSALDGTPGWGTQLPPEATKGEQLSLYFQARNKRGKVVASVGSVVEPVVVDIHGANEGATAARGVRDDSDLEPEPAAPKDSGYWWLGLGVGFGYGYAGSSGPEIYKNQVLKYTPGVAFAKAAQITPEVGYFLTPSLSVSLQGRIQYIPQVSGRPATASEAVAFLGRLLYFMGGKTLRFYGAGILGGGQGFRLYLENLKRTNNRSEVNDTVLGGPVVIGVGAGMAVGLSDSWSWFLEINGLAGIPDISAVADINTGVRLRL